MLSIKTLFDNIKKIVIKKKSISVIKLFIKLQMAKDIMQKDENIFIKLEISRNPINGNLDLITRFDPNAPNIIKNENGFSWSPTNEEREFLNEAFELIYKKKL